MKTAGYAVPCSFALCSAISESWPDQELLDVLLRRLCCVLHDAARKDKSNQRHRSKEPYLSFRRGGERFGKANERWYAARRCSDLELQGDRIGYVFCRYMSSCELG